MLIQRPIDGTAIAADGTVVSAANNTERAAHTAQALSRLLQRWKSKVKLEALLSSYTEEVALLENAIWDVIVSRFPDFAYGEQLDILGRIVGEARNNRDDDRFRIRIKARIKINASFGRWQDIETVLTMVTEAAYILEELYPAGLRVTFTELPVYTQVLITEKGDTLITESGEELLAESVNAVGAELPGIVQETRAAGIGGHVLRPTSKSNVMFFKHTTAFPPLFASFNISAITVGDLDPFNTTPGDGHTDAVKITDTNDGSSVQHIIFFEPVPGFVAGSTVQIEIWAKAGTKSWLHIQHGAPLFPGISLNASTGAVGTSVSGGSAALLGSQNGWFRWQVTIPNVQTSQVVLMIMNADIGGGSGAYQGNGTGTILVFGGRMFIENDVRHALSNAVPSVQSIAGLGSWTLANLTRAPATSPLGDTSAFIFTDSVDGSPQFHLASTVAQGRDTSIGGLEISAKAGTKTWLLVQPGPYFTDRVWLNTSTGALGTVSGNSSVTVINQGNGWYRFRIINSKLNPVASNGLGVDMYFAIVNANGNDTYTGAGTGTISFHDPKFICVNDGYGELSDYRAA